MRLKLHSDSLATADLSNIKTQLFLKKKSTSKVILKLRLKLHFALLATTDLFSPLRIYFNI